MSRTYRRKTGYQLADWSKTFGVHQYRKQPTLEQMKQDYQYDLIEDKLRQRKYHTDHSYFSCRNKNRKEYSRLLGLRSAINQECHRLVRTGEYDTFDDSHVIAKYGFIAWIVDD